MPIPDFEGDSPAEALTQSPDAAISAGRAVLEACANSVGGSAFTPWVAIDCWLHPENEPPTENGDAWPLYAALVELGKAVGWEATQEPGPTQHSG